MSAVDDEPPTEKVLARVNVGEGDELVTVGQLSRGAGVFWVERINGARRPFKSFELAMLDIEQIQTAFVGRLESFV